MSERILVVGPPGSGKTTFLRDRFTDLMREDPSRTDVLFLVANRKAARAAQEHALRALGRSVAEVRVATWHAFALGLLTDHYDRLEYTKPPALLTAPEQFALVREMLRDPDERAHWRDREEMISLRGFAEALREFVLRVQDALLSPREVLEIAEDAGDDALTRAAEFFERYLRNIDAQDVVDHGNAIALAAELMQNHPELPRPAHVLVDDYQDVSIAQEALLKELVAAGASVAAAGDPESHLFSFRGTSLDPFGRFESVFAPAAVRRLQGSRRGSPAPEAWVFEHLSEEAHAVARECVRLHEREGISWGDVAVIVRRYGGVARAVRRAMARAGVPHVVVGENRPLAHEPALRPMLDLARAAVRPEDREDDLLSAVLASPAIGLDPYQVRALRREARLRERSLAGLVAAPPGDLPQILARPLQALAGLLSEIADRNAAERPDEVFWFLWDRLDYFATLVAEGRHEDLDAVEAFAEAIRRFADRRPGKRFSDYLDVLAAAEFGPEPWVLPEERRPDAVRVLTAYHASGLEFEAVVVAGCVEGEFPNLGEVRPLFSVDRPSAPPADRRAARLADERRLFGVAVSRARRRLLLTASRRTGEGQPQTLSPFAERLGVIWTAPPDPVEALTPEEIEAAARRRLADRRLPDAERLDALAILARLSGVDPGSWWFERDWTDPGIPIAPDPLRTSYSRLTVYENCPLQYLYQVELGLDPSETHQMLVGTWVHDIVDRCARGEIDRSEDALLAALAARWDPSIFPSEAVEHRRRLDSEEMLRRWLRTDGDLATLESEVSFEFPLDGAVMRGKIDRIVRLGGRSVRLIDYKTSRNAKREDDAKEDLQLASYFLALKRDPHLTRLGEPKWLELAYLGAFWKGGFVRRGFDPTQRPGYEEEAERRLLEFVEGIKAERFGPSPEADCTFCSFKTLCPVWPEGDEVRT